MCHVSVKFEHPNTLHTFHRKLVSFQEKEIVSERKRDEEANCEVHRFMRKAERFGFHIALTTCVNVDSNSDAVTGAATAMPSPHFVGSSSEPHYVMFQI